MEVPYVSVTKVELRDDGLESPVMVFQVKIEWAETNSLWIEEYTDIGELRAFLKGLRAAYAREVRINLPLISVFPTGIVNITNPRKKYWCKKCLGHTAMKIPDVQGWDGSCERCGCITQEDVLDFKPCPHCKGTGKRQNEGAYGPVRIQCSLCDGTGRAEREHG